MPFEQIFFILWNIGVVAMISVFIIKGRNSLKIFPELDKSDFEYIENRASGYSTQSFKTKMGGTSNLLRIRVTKDQLWLTSNPLLAWIADRYDLLHNIPIESITSIKVDKKNINVQFEKDGKAKAVVLISQKSDQLAQLLHAKKDKVKRT